MRVGKIGHASLVVSTDEIQCFMDPVFDDPFESGANTLDPPIKVDTSSFSERCNLLVISHGHWDHFSPRSLDLFDRSTTVLFPEGEDLVQAGLERLGFTNCNPVTAGMKIEFGDLTLIPTQSKVPFPEMGMVFVADDRVFWNLVDTNIDEMVVASVRSLVKPPDLLFAKYQPLVENELRSNALGSDFPLSRYSTLLRNVWTINPRYLAPASCGYRYVRGDWLNDRGFPITERQFERDVTEVAPSLRVLHVPHGGAVELADEMEVDPNGLEFVKRLGDRMLSSFDWRPERGVPPLADQNPRNHSPETLREQVSRFLDDSFLGGLNQCDPVWLEKMARLGVVWRLEVVYPDGTAKTRLLDLTQRPFAWMTTTDDVFVKIHTSITASGIVGLLRGECNAYSLTFNDIRISNRLYSVHREGVSSCGTLEDEPLGQVLYPGSEERYLDFELRAILGEESR